MDQNYLNPLSTLLLQVELLHILFKKDKDEDLTHHIYRVQNMENQNKYLMITYNSCHSW